MNIEFPINIQSFLTVAGAATFAAIVAQWVKHYLPDWRFTNLVVLGLAELFAIVARFIAAGWHPTGAAVFGAVLIGLAGATLATFGYELVQNILGVAGVGPRSTPSD